MQPDRNDPLVGTMLGKDYRVLEPIGAGGMAVVYLVEHQTLLKQFAAKVLSPALATSLEARARFAQEAHAASQLDHENIVSISDFGATNDQRPFFVMELLRGNTLDQRLAEGAMSLEEVVAVAVPVARALAHAHAEGIVHLDVKPENIFLVQRSQGRWGVKVVDFGIAKTPLNPRMTKVGETAGSPLFMAPEVCQGSDDVDLRADVYSFGIVLYLMLCGRLPFVDDEDNVARILQMQLVELPPPPREINDALSPELAAIVERCLAKDPRDRYPLMAVLLRDFQAALPEDADRLLIEQQSGASLHETPFPRSMSLGMFDSEPQPITQPGLPPSMVMHAAHSMPPSGLHASQPSPIPGRRRALIVLTAALVTVAVVLAGALAWKRMNSSKTQLARGDGQAASLIQAGGATPAGAAAPAPAAPAAAPPSQPEAAPAGAAVPAAEANAQPAADETADSADSAAADDEPAPSATAARIAATASPSERTKLSRPAAINTKPPLRTKPTVRRDPPARPGAKRVATIAAPAGSAGRPGSASLAVEQPASEPAAPLAVAAAEAPRPEPPRPEPIAAPPPAPVQTAPLPAPAPPVSVSAPAKADPGTLDAIPAVTSLDVKGSLSPAIVRRGVERSLVALRNCYRTAAKAGGATPSIDLRLNFEIDENGLATQVSTGGTTFGSLPGCAASVVSQIRTQEAPDVGTVQVSVGIRFRPS